jgi:hypothetical protein
MQTKANGMEARNGIHVSGSAFVALVAFWVSSRDFGSIQ